MDALLHDFRHALRLMRRQPLLSGVAVLTLGLGIGATTAMFVVLNSVLWRPLPYDRDGRLVTVLENEGGRRRSPTSPANYLDWSRSRTLEAMTAAHPWSPALTGRERADRLVGLKATPQLFDLLDARPLLGRTFSSADAGEARVVVLGHALWQRRFGGDRAIVGRRLVLDGEPYEVVGVMPEGFAFPPFWHTGAEFWAPLVLTPEQSVQRGARMLRVFARLREGASIEQARSELTVVHERLAREYPKENANTGVDVEPLLEPTVGDARTALFVLLGAVGFVLLIACANVAGLLLARASAQAGETALRLALGAGAWRIVRQHLAYGLVLATAGGTLGVLLSSWGVGALAHLEVPGLPRAREIGIDTRALLFACVVLLSTGVLVALAPALAALRGDVLPRLRGGGERGTARRGVGRSWLVASELALAVVLLVGAGLLLRSFWKMQSADPGFSREHVLTLSLDLPRSRYSDAEQQARFLDVARERLGQVQGVQHAAFINHLPVGGDTWGTRLTIDGAPIPRPGEEPRASFRVTTPGYFRAAGIRQISGRDFDDRDRASAPRAAIVNETFVRQYLAAVEAVGHRVAMGDPDTANAWLTVVGVVADARQGSVRDPIEPEIFLPYHQNPVAFYTTSSLVARTRGAAEEPRRAIEAVLRVLEPNAPILDVKTMAQVVDRSMASARLNASLLTGFAAVAVLLAALGLYGVISYAASQRTREFGIRMALGADRSRLVALVLGQAAVPVLAGGAAGLVGSLGLTRALAGTLYGVTPADVPTYAAVIGLLAAAALAASAVPAVRASRLNPVRALRENS